MLLLSLFNFSCGCFDVRAHPTMFFAKPETKKKNQVYSKELKRSSFLPFSFTLCICMNYIHNYYIARGSLVFSSSRVRLKKKTMSKVKKG
jgi:hypothetical protein